MGHHNPVTQGIKEYHSGQTQDFNIMNTMQHRLVITQTVRDH
jgi:hypothetical protein